ncbi:hypothetical protein SLE2022_248390 [Rubroshorea leprosula]
MDKISQTKLGHCNFHQDITKHFHKPAVTVTTDCSNINLQVTTINTIQKSFDDDIQLSVLQMDSTIYDQNEGNQDTKNYQLYLHVLKPHLPPHLGFLLPEILCL